MRARVLRLIILATGLGLAGCQKGLFPQNAPRTQFDQAEALRGEFIPETQRDVYGNQQPALRARLSPARWQ